MSGLIPVSFLAHKASQICCPVVFLGLAFAAHMAQSEEGYFAPDTDILKVQLVRSDTDLQPSWRLDTDSAFNRSGSSIATGSEFGHKPRLFLVAEPKKENDWSFNIQKQNPAGGDCSSLVSLVCTDSKEEQPADIQPPRQSFWVVLRKAFHF